MGNNPTPQNWSDTTTDQKVNINNGVILSKASYFNFAASKSYVETARSGGLIIDPDILKQRFYEDLITGEYDPTNGYFKNGLTEKEAAYVANNYVYHGTGLSGEEDQLTMLSSVDDPNERYVISSGSNSVEEKWINNPRTVVGSTTGDLGQDINALTGDNSSITFGKTLDPNYTYNFVGHSNGGARSVETAQWFFDNGFTIGEILAYNSPGTPYGRWEDRPNPNSNFGGTHRVWVSLDRPIADKITYITNG
ncbi:hypothetical protein MNBD_ALPHA01-1433 [hydrothermal vent metagenome]|uniref:Uncharacterized protein n=1 Tax=hydrothermal vent metagenome TaxID=652676 RepID=A0A3B0SAP7_9ZZZZ